MSEAHIDRRRFLTRAWQAGGALMAAAGVVTAWDILQPLTTGGFGGVVRAATPDAVADEAVLGIPAARSYLTRISGQVLALSEKCPHLGCRVSFCDSSSMFECPCHGTVFNRAGELVSGPSPRGMDRYPSEVGEDGFIYIDTAGSERGPAPGVSTIDSTPTGPSCAIEGGH